MAFTFVFSLHVSAQGPVIVQPGAPGEASRILPSSTRAVLPPRSRKDVEFMQGMIHHHAQAVEMTDLIEERTDNKQIRLIGERISKSQLDEMALMKRWLEMRGETAEMAMQGGPNTDGHSLHGKEPHKGGTQNAQHLMPGMLTQKQMNALRKAKGREFDNLFLIGMIQHHNGALIMVKDLFDTDGAGQDAEVFNFATDVDSGQRAEIATMQTLLARRP